MLAQGGTSDKQEPFEVQLAVDAENLTAAPVVGKTVHAQAILSLVDGSDQHRCEPGDLPLSEGAFEHGLLHPHSVAAANLGNLSESTLASLALGAHIVRNQDPFLPRHRAMNGMYVARSPRRCLAKMRA